MKCSVWSCSAEKRIGGAIWSFRLPTIAAQISLDGQIVCKVLRQKFGEVRCFHWTPPSGE